MTENPLHLEPEMFDELVSDVLDELPPEWAPLLDNLAVVVEEEPTEEDLAAEHAGEAGAFFGLYRGRGGTFQLLGGGLAGPAAVAPPEIALFQGPLERASSDMDALRQRVHDTLVAEIGHVLGFRTEDEDEDEGDEDEGDEDDNDLADEEHGQDKDDKE